MTVNVNRSIAKGVAWMIAARLLVRGLGLISTVILARLLLPQDFGLVAMATSLIAAVELLTAFSFETVLIQRQEISRPEFDTAWTLNALLATSVCLILIALAPAAAVFYNEPRLKLVIDFLALATLVRGFENIGTVILRKDLAFHKDFWLQAKQKIAAASVTITLAFLLRNYWALIAGMITGAVINVIQSYFAYPYRPSFTLSASAQLFRHSRWLVVNNGITFVRNRGADFMIGKINGSDALGLFSVAYEISNLPTSEMVAPINRAAYPGYVRMAGDPVALRAGFANVLGFIALFALPAATGIAAIADVLVAAMLGERWSAAAPLISILALSGAAIALQTNTGSVYNAVGKPRFLPITGFIHAGTLVPMLLVSLYLYGPIGAAWAYLVNSALIGLPVTYTLFFLATPIKPRDALSVVWRPIVACCAMFPLVRGSLSAMREYGVDNNVLLLGGAVSVGALVYLAAILLLWIACSRPAGSERHLLQEIRMRMARFV